MGEVKGQNVIDIRPATSVYGTYRRLSYTPWFAIAEFIDNSTQSYYDHRNRLRETDGFKKLIINIEYNPSEGYLEIKDNAYGMDFNNFQRAIILDKPPKNRTGRNEFGMGLKTAACWFGDLWSVETSQLGLDKVYSATMDIKFFEQNKPESVYSKCNNTNPEQHFTKIVIKDLNQKPQKRSVSKIKTTLERIYRKDLQSGEIDIIWNGEHLEYVAPELREENGELVRKELNFNVESPFGDVYKVTGWVGVLKKGSYSNAGFALLRRGRVVVGAIDNYAPDLIFGSSGGDYRKLYLCGELNLDNFPATQAKDNFVWDNGLEDNFLEKLNDEIDDIKKKAQSMRQVNQSMKVAEIPEKTINDIVDGTKGSFENIVVDLNRYEDLNEVNLIGYQSDMDSYLSSVEIEQKVSPEKKSIEMYNFQADGYNFTVMWTDENELAPWLTIKEHHDEFGNLTKDIDVIINVCHKFFVPYINKPDFLMLVNKLALAMIIAEKRAKSISTSDDLKIDPESIRNQMNRCLAEIAAKE